MTVAAMIHELARAGIRLSRDGDRLHAQAARGMLTPLIREQLAASKPELLAFLDSPDAMRARLLILAEQLGVDATHVHQQSADDLVECRGLSDDTLRDWLRLRDSCRVCSEGKATPR